MFSLLQGTVRPCTTDDLADALYTALNTGMAGVNIDRICSIKAAGGIVNAPNKNAFNNIPKGSLPYLSPEYTTIASTNTGSTAMAKR